MREDMARGYLERGLHELAKQAPDWDWRQRNFEGDQQLPYAPPGVSAEYLALREQSVANYLELAMKAPIQRMKAEGFRTRRGEDADLQDWVDVWQPNHLATRQSVVYQQMINHGRGIMSVSPNPLRRRSPKIRPENSRRVWLEPNPEDPFESLFAVKQLLVKDPTASASDLILPSSMTQTRRVAYVYTAREWARFVAEGEFGSRWRLDDSGAHRMGRIPFVKFDFNTDADGKPRPAIDKLIPQQNAINTIRFNTLLAMQFSAYRQRIFTGYDPVVRDSKGNPIQRKNPDGTPMLDENGMPLYALNSPGRIGVDRALVFPGEKTKVFELDESNLTNYISALQQFLTDFFATGQIPPQYALTKMANLTGDGMAGAESTFQSLISDIKDAAEEGLSEVMNLASIARGDGAEPLASEVIWSDTEVRSFAQIVDAIGKLITSGMSRADAWAFLPSATPPKVSKWVDNSDADRDKADAALGELGSKIGI